jgi:hypothetical protein
MLSPSYFFPDTLVSYYLIDEVINMLFIVCIGIQWTGKELLLYLWVPSMLGASTNCDSALWLTKGRQLVRHSPVAYKGPYIFKSCPMEPPLHCLITTSLLVPLDLSRASRGSQVSSRARSCRTGNCCVTTTLMDNTYLPNESRSSLSSWASIQPIRYLWCSWDQLNYAALY